MNLFVLEQKESERVNLLAWASERPRKRFTLADAMAAFGMNKGRIFSRIQELEARNVIRRTGKVIEKYTEFEVAQ